MRQLVVSIFLMLLNFDLPNDIDDYVHRIGRTGRAGNSGLATAFFSDNNTSLADLMQESNQEVPAWLTRYASRASYGSKGGRDFRRDSSFNRSGSSGGYGGGGGYGQPSAWD
ncbi:hypothetical protein ACS0TY_031612 [Phlomoides rotata]